MSTLTILQLRFSKRLFPFTLFTHLQRINVTPQKSNSSTTSPSLTGH